MKIDRLIGILSILLQQDKVTAPLLAEKFEVSRRTINRDIEDLCKAGIPLVTTQGRTGGISIADGYRIDRTLLTSSDMNAILAGLRSLDSVSGTNRYSVLMERLSPGASDLVAGGQHILIDLSSWYKTTLSQKIELISSAIEVGRKISFKYFSPKSETLRVIEPYNLIFQWSNWYVWGWCEKREDFRLFKLNRIIELRCTGENFCKREAPLPDLSQENIFPYEFQVRAIFDPECRWRLIEEFGPDCIEEQKDGNLKFSFGFTDRESIISWILTFRDKAELMEPEDIRKELYEIGKAIKDKYAI